MQLLKQKLMQLELTRLHNQKMMKVNRKMKMTTVKSNEEKSFYRSQPSPRANLSIDDARKVLKEYNSKSWVKCVKAVDPSSLKSKQMDDDLQEEFLPIQVTKPSKFPEILIYTFNPFFSNGRFTKIYE